MKLPFLAAIAAAAAIFVSGAGAHRNAHRPSWIDSFSWAVAICETGKGHNHPDFRHHAGSYEGAWGWYHSTWLLDRPKGAPYYAYQASPKQQYAAFKKGWFRLRHYWGCIANGGYRYWMP